MKRLLCYALCLMLGFLPSLAAALTLDELNWQADDYFKKSHTVGGAVVVTLGDQIVYQHYFGNQDSARQIPVTQNTYFRIASVTKMVSGIGMLQLLDQGLVDLDEDISSYFGYEIANTYYPGTPITLRQLMSHTSSVRGTLPGSTRTLYSTLAKEERKNAYFNKTKPGSIYAYSNFGAGITGAIIEATTGENVNTYMRENVFGPLAIDASYVPSTLADPDSITNLYKYDGTRYRSASYVLKETYEDVADPETHYRTTIGSLWIRAEDLATLAIALCGDGSVNGVRLLSPETTALMRRDQASFGASVTGESPYGLFLQREDTLIDGHTFYGHQGMLEGILCNVYYEPETHFCFVMLTNGCHNVMDHHVGVLSRRMFNLAYQSFVSNEE